MVRLGFCLRIALAFSLLNGVSAQAQRLSGGAASNFVAAAPEIRVPATEIRTGFSYAWCDEKTRIETGAVGCLMEKFIKTMNAYWVPILKSIWALPVGLLLILQWHRYQSEILRALGIGLVIVNIYYCETWGATEKRANQDAFIRSCFVLFIDEVILFNLVHRGYVLWRRFAQRKGISLRASSESMGQTLLPGRIRSQSFSSVRTESLARSMHGKMNEQLKKAKKNIAFNVYMDFRKSPRRAALTFLAQMGLFLFYMYELNGGNDDDDSPGILSQNPSKFSALKWFFAIALIVVTGHGETGRTCNYNFWWTQIDKITLVEDGSGQARRKWLAGWCGKEVWEWQCSPPILHVLMRFFFDFVANGIQLSIIKGTVPIMLAVEGPLDFVKDATALFFLLKLDEIEEDKDLADIRTWDFSNDDVGYTIDEFDDMMYNCDTINKPLKFPTRKEIIEIAETNLTALERGEQYDTDKNALTPKKESGGVEEEGKKVSLDMLMEKASSMSEQLSALCQEIAEMKKTTSEECFGVMSMTTRDVE